MNSENKIVVTSWNGKSWEMTPEQIEAAYRYKERQYRIDDAYNQLELNADWIEEKYGYSYNEIIEFSEELAERFHDNFDCNESENDAWIDRITEMFDSLGRKESNDD
jgi:hypothetical protein